MERFIVIERPHYTEQIRAYVGQPIIKILTGQRRVGKSFILKQLMEKISHTDKQTHIIYIDKELKEFASIQTDDDLYQYVVAHLQPEKQNYLFVDEVQEINRFQYALRSLLAEGKCDIYCTGSNATMLSGELATYLAGRYMEFPIHPLSYGEFLHFHHLSDSNESLQRYMRIGGMPYLIHLKGDEQLSMDYLQNLHSTILLKDVIYRKQIRNIDFMERLIAYLSDNIGSLFSATNISRYLKSQRQQLPTQMVIDYSMALVQAYFLHKVPRADVQGLKLFEIGEKYYFEDLGLRNVISGINPLADIQKWMENLVYMQLLRLGYQVFIGKVEAQEIDFIASRLEQRIYVQVAYRMDAEKTRGREISALMKVEDHFPKYIVTLDDFLTGVTTEGIRIVHLRTFLLEYRL
jgi:predicted AAA+ superfamily ATPase